MINASTLNIDIIKQLILNDVSKMGFAFSLPEFIENNIKNGIFENKFVKDEPTYKVNDYIFILDNKKDENDSRHWVETQEDKVIRKSIGFAIIVDKELYFFDVLICKNGKPAIINNETKIKIPLSGCASEIKSFYYCSDDNGILLTGPQELFDYGMIHAFQNMKEKKFYFSNT